MPDRQFHLSGPEWINTLESIVMFKQVLADIHWALFHAPPYWLSQAAHRLTYVGSQ